MDSGAADAGPDDAGQADAAVADAGTSDAGGEDGGSLDGGSRDAGHADAGSADAGTPDAGTPDAGTPDAGSADAGEADAGPGDAGTGGCATGLPAQALHAAMVGCDCQGSVCAVLPYQAGDLCAPGWHVCTLDEWDARRGGQLSNRNRYVLAVLTTVCTGCANDRIGPSTQMCEESVPCSNNANAYYAGPLSDDPGCASWGASLAHGNVNRTNGTMAVGRDPCLLGVGASRAVVGSLCCQ